MYVGLVPEGEQLRELLSDASASKMVIANLHASPSVIELQNADRREAYPTAAGGDSFAAADRY